VLESSAARLFWIARTQGMVLELDPSCATPVGQPWSANDADGDAGASSDPQDIAVDAYGRVWVARFMVSTVLVKSSDGSQALGTIDLSDVTGVRRNPFMSAIRIVNGEAYVSLEMLNPNGGDQPDGPSYLVRIDVLPPPQLGTVSATLKLQGENPFGLMLQDGDDTLYLAEPGSFYSVTEQNAGIEKVTLSPLSSEMVVREADIGANVLEVSLQDSCLTAIVASVNPSLDTWVVAYDMASSKQTVPLSQQFLYSATGGGLSGMTVLPGGQTVIGDRTLVSGQGYPLHLVTSTGCVLQTASPALYAPEAPVGLIASPGGH
jgi:hypothetical protein